MKKIVADMFAIIYKATKSNIVSLILTVSIVTVLSFFILHGIIMLTDGLLPLKFLLILYSGKIQYFTFTVLAITFTLMCLRLTRNLSRLNKNPDYLLITFFVIIAILLSLYIRYADLLNT